MPLPLVASSQPPVIASLWPSTGPRTWASILQSEHRPGTRWANPVKTPVICKITTSFRLCLQTGPTKSEASEVQSYSLTGCMLRIGEEAPTKKAWTQPRSLLMPESRRNQLERHSAMASLIPTCLISCSWCQAECHWMCPNYCVDQILRTFRPEFCFFFSFPQTAVKSAALYRWDL